MFTRPALLLVAFAAQAAPPPIVITLDPAQTTIEYTLGDVLHTVHGTFKLRSGRIEINPRTQALSGKAIVDASTGNSGSNARDSRMKKNILEIDRYPEITFEPTAVTGFLPGPEPSDATVTGWFTIHGQRHQISVPMRLTLTGTTAAATGKFTVPYVAWGMKNPSTFLLRVNETVDVVLNAAGTIAK